MRTAETRIIWATSDRLLFDTQVCPCFHEELTSMPSSRLVDRPVEERLIAGTAKVPNLRAISINQSGPDTGGACNGNSSHLWLGSLTLFYRARPDNATWTDSMFSPHRPPRKTQPFHEQPETNKEAIPSPWLNRKMTPGPAPTGGRRHETICQTRVWEVIGHHRRGGATWNHFRRLSGLATNVELPRLTTR